MDYKSILGAGGAIVAVVQYAFYIRSTLLGKTKPHAFSWFIWGVPCGVVFLAQLLKGGGAGSWTTGATAILCTVIFVLALFRGEKEITRFDWAFFGLALLAVALWFITKDPLGTVILITLADILGMAPTLRKSYAKPHEEMLSAFAIANVKWILSLAALQVFSVTTALYPVAMFLSTGALVLMLAHRRKAVAENP